MFNQVLKWTLTSVLMVGLSNLAAAQYGGGGGTGGGMPGSPTYNPHGSYSNKGAIIGGVVAGGAAAVGGLLYWKHHHAAKLQGCVSGSGDKLVNEKDNQTYSLSNPQNETLKPGERVQLSGKKAKDDGSGQPTFEVRKLSKDLGQCTATTAEQRQ